MKNVLIKDLPENDKPRERLIINGVKNISNEELISIILKTGTKNRSVKDLSNILLSNFNNISDMKDIELNTLIKIKGIGKVKALELIAAIELGRRVYIENNNLIFNVKNSKDIYIYFNEIFRDLKQEHFYVLYLDHKKNVIDKKLLFIGTINASITHPREIFKYAYLMSASFIICIHNHPSKDPTPSKEDEYFTKNIMEIGTLQGIPIIDHLIIGGNSYYSFYEKKLFKI